MKKSFLIFTFTLILQSNVLAEKNCKDLPGFKKLGKGSVEYTKCIAKKGKELGKKGLKKLNTESKLTDWIKKQINK
tara:strand:- start:221 stop:448 length:228 start_codon:yes stop_codon:yes gene_type:complete